MTILGLTGGPGMGKSFAAREFEKLGASVFDADKAVHASLEPGEEGYAKVAAHFPEVVVDGKIDRKRLGAIVFEDEVKRHELEAILHPQVRIRMNQFITQEKMNHAKLIVLDIPLLFEGGLNKQCDKTLAVLVDAATQMARLKERGLDENRAQQIIAAHMPAEEKARRSDYVIETKGPDATEKIKQLYETLTR